MPDGAFQSTPPRRGDRASRIMVSPHQSFNPRPREGATSHKQTDQLGSRVSIHAPAKGRHAAVSGEGEIPEVSIHAPAKGRLRPVGLGHGRGRFQSTPPRRGDRTAPSCTVAPSGFNPRPREGATSHTMSRVNLAGGFNPRPREGATAEGDLHAKLNELFQSTPPRRGDLPRRPGAVRGLVSIHAPAKGRRLALHSGRDLGGFNPRPREGATFPGGLERPQPRCFNPRPREGATHRGAHPPRPAWVSIHAPAKGRQLGQVAAVWVRGFQSTPPRRGDLSCLPVPGESAPFQSTPPRRGDPAVRPLCVRQGGFNPRPREGATCTDILLPKRAEFQSTPPRRGDRPHAPAHVRDLVVSIHAPAKGRHRPAEDAPDRHGFQSTPPRRGDFRSRAGGSSERVFQSTPPRRGDCEARTDATRAWCFNPRPREGATPLPGILMELMNAFQSTPPRRGDRRRRLHPRLARSFNPRPREGATSLSLLAMWPRATFQSTPPRRGDPTADTSRPPGARFNPRPREGATSSPPKRPRG